MNRRRDRFLNSVKNWNKFEEYYCTRSKEGVYGWGKLRMSNIQVYIKLNYVCAYVGCKWAFMYFWNKNHCSIGMAFYASPDPINGKFTLKNCLSISCGLFFQCWLWNGWRYWICFKFWLNWMILRNAQKDINITPQQLKKD